MATEEILFKEINPNLHLFGQINEKSCLEFIAELWALCTEILATPKTPLEISITINSEGGCISDMNAIADAIEFVKNSGFTVHTIGLGQVMSAGLIIFGLGSKGCRKIGKSTRLMFHPIIAGHEGTFNNIKSEYKETEFVQQDYINKLLEITTKDKQFFIDLLNKDINYYFDATEAIEWGLADTIFAGIPLKNEPKVNKTFKKDIKKPSLKNKDVIITVSKPVKNPKKKYIKAK